jgi:serine/threonine protein kinase
VRDPHATPIADSDARSVAVLPMSASRTNGVYARSVESPTNLRDGRYTVVGTLGDGAQATTLEAEDGANGGRRVAIKRFNVRGAESWKDVELAEREARVLARLDHAGLPRYVEHFEENGALYLVMEKIEGESLAARLKERGPMSEPETRAMLHELAAALEYLHERDVPIVHRDIKPTNVIRRRDGSFVLIDFGAVRDRLRPEGGSTVVGTFGYMAPEQFQGRALPASDTYAAGVTALAALTGKQPEDLPHRGLRIDVRAALRDVRPTVTEGFVRALDAMVEPDPDARPARITPLLELEPPRPPAPAAKAPPPPRSVRRGRDRPRGRRKGPRSPVAPYIGLLWMAWGISWAIFTVNWTYMLLATIPIIAASRWSQEWSRKRQDEELERENAAEQTRARVESGASRETSERSDARVRVPGPEDDEALREEDAPSEREPARRARE